MPEATDNLPAVAFQYNGTDVLYDSERLVDLTSMWRSEGSPANKAPKDWIVTEGGKGFVASLGKNLNVAKNHIWKSKRGKHMGGTWAHWQIAVAYAKYLSHEFHRHVNAAFVEWSKEVADPTLKFDRAIDALQQKGFDKDWAVDRVEGKYVRKDWASKLKDHNCKKRGEADNPYAEITRSNSIAVIGCTPKEFKAKKGLPVKAVTRDHMSKTELAAFKFLETAQQEAITEDRADGNEECKASCLRVSKPLASMMEAIRPRPTDNRKDSNV